MRLYNLLIPLILGLVLFILSFNSFGASIPLIMESGTNPVAAPKAMVKSGEARFTVLTPALIRMEWAPGGIFEDRPSLSFINRRLSIPEFTSSSQSGWLVIETTDLVLKYQEGSGAFNSENLTVELKSKTTPSIWNPGKEDTGNLGGTLRTLDQVSGAVPVGKGLISKEGWGLFDDSQTPLIDKNQWPTVRSNKGLDWYFFGYGHNYKKALKDFTQIAGRIPLPPRWSFGTWWSRYWDYTEQELKDLVEEFHQNRVPLDVLVLDMGWHLPGWTGFTWNPDYFPNPKEFLKWCHKQNLHITLNLHPHEGVSKQESAFPLVAKALELHPDSIQNIPFDITNKKFMEAYFQYLLHPIEMQGVDFWWIDWQQGDTSKIPGLDPLFWLNHLHWKDFEDNPYRNDLRPMIMSRWGGVGSHRFPIGFSGDTYSNWETLKFLPYFTATAGNIGYPFWSHDIGGHFPGPVEGELYARWIQFGVFSPFLRTHATKDSRAERRIWAFGEEIYQSARAFFDLRYSLLPYIYTMARHSYDSGLPLIRPLYYEWPEINEAYEYRGEYLFGEQLLVAPVTSPVDPSSGLASAEVWIPPGGWFGWFDGRKYQGPQIVTMNSTLNNFPLFVKEGGIIPQISPAERIADKVFDSYILNIFPGEAGAFKLYEDDGSSRGYQKGEYAKTLITFKQEGRNLNIAIAPPNGSFKGLPQKRAFDVLLRDVWPVKSIWVNGALAPKVPTGKKSAVLCWWYDSKLFTVHLQIPKFYTSEPLNIVVQMSSADDSALQAGLRGKFECLENIKSLLGEKTPAEITSLIERKNEIFSKVVKDENLPNAAGVVDRQWGELAIKSAKAEVDPILAGKAFLQMVGVKCDLELKQVNPGELLVEAISITDKTLTDLAVKISYKVPVNWSEISEPMRDYCPISSDNPLTQTATFRIDSIPSPSIFQAEFTVKLGECEVNIIRAQTIFPSINAWKVIGPFDNPTEAGLDIAFPPEQNLDFNAEYFKADGSKLMWGSVSRGAELPVDADFVVNLNSSFNGEFTNSAAYAFTYLYSPQDMALYLTLGSDDGVAVWVNGECILQSPEPREYTPRQDKIAINLKAGNNTLLLKVLQSSGDWRFSAGIEDETGDPAWQVKSKLKP